MKTHTFLKYGFALLGFLFFIPKVHAHCPLCTAGAVVAAGGAAYLGVSSAVIGLFIGAFAVSTGWWASTWLKKEYVPRQKEILILLAFLFTVIPILPIISGVYPVLISIAGEYGSLLNRTYIINPGLITSILGGIIVCITPAISRKITEKRKGKMIPYQGILLTFALLLIIGVLIQVII